MCSGSIVSWVAPIVSVGTWLRDLIMNVTEEADLSTILREKLPTAPGGREPLPEGVFYLLLTGEIPTALGNLLLMVEMDLSENILTGAVPDGFGFKCDNYCGSTKQENAWTPDWETFWKNRRLGPQIRLAKNYLDQNTRSSFHALYKRLPEILGDTLNDSPALLHGDLWGGNHLADQSGNPVIIDPAVYYGHREADLAMTTLFSGYPRDFHESYENDYPLKPGFWEKRIHLYQLYHLLNHLNIFGASYLSGVQSKLNLLLS